MKQEWSEHVRAETARYNSLENPIGIETYPDRIVHHAVMQLQLIRKPDRDWNSEERPDYVADITELQLIRKPDRDWNAACRSCGAPTASSYNSLENPIGIETKTVDALPVGQD